MADSVSRTRSSIGILAYGSLIADPGAVLDPLIVDRIEAVTPFPVEYARLSVTRGGAPTAVPHSSGNPVKAKVLALADGVSLGEACSLLWRRETRNEGTGKAYRESKNANSVVVRDLPDFCGLAHVLYTDFNLEGKIANPDPESLARAAIDSVGRAATGRDGISYLMGLQEAGVETALTSRYIAEILSRTGSNDLGDALRQLEPSTREWLRDGKS